MLCKGFFGLIYFFMSSGLAWFFRFDSVFFSLARVFFRFGFGLVFSISSL
jgi:hypothetical protein